MESLSSSFKDEEFLGVSPLLFAVNAIHDDQHRSILFDSFLSAVATSSRHDATDDTTSTTTTTNKKTISLFRPDGEDYSSDEDDGFQDFLNHNTTNHHPRSTTTFTYLGNNRRPPNDGVTEHETSYAKIPAKNFFQRARILSVSERYGLPPSKDPEGTHNLAYELSAAYRRRLADCIQHVSLAFERYPIAGIMPSGWLEKHRHALPSVIMVVCTVCSSQIHQAEQDRRLFSVVEHLQYSLVPKRHCSVQIVGIMTDGVSDAQGQDWSHAIYQDIVLEQQQESPNTIIAITLLRASSDLQQQSDTPALQKLMKSMEDASILYYLRQARRTKDKLLKLVDDKKRKNGTPLLLSPLIIRYCCKIAVFYEFQQKHEKCIRFLIIAYRQTTKYYNYLLERLSSTSATATNEQSPSRTSSPLTIGVSGESVEMELGSPEKGIVWSEIASPPPDDALYQCCGVAEWLNQKLLVSGFSSQTEGGLVAAANQWRQHTRHFAIRHAYAESWWDYLYITRQRGIMSYLVERFPLKALSGGEYEEVVLRCSSWRAYESTAEAMLHLNRALDSVRNESSVEMTQASTADGLRNRYIGGFSSGLSRKELSAQMKINHVEEALKLVLKAISIFEREQERLKLGFYAEDEFSERHSCRTGARLFYLAGGILLGMEQHEEAANHLSKASRYATGWRELELSIRRMLISCYEKHIPTEDNASSENLASMILDSYFNAEMSSQDLRTALSHFAAVTGGDTLQWRHEARDEQDESLPVSFSVNFPGKTHATLGDAVVAAVTIKSNLDYAIHLTSAKLKTLAGEIEIPTNDLLAAKNASEGTDGIIVQAKASILVSTRIELPKDVSMIAFDESGNGGELQGTAGKGAFAKNAKPRSAGVTAAGGARLVSEEKLKVGNANSQGWNLQCLGGKPLLCDGLKLRFYPVQAERTTGGSEQLTIIELIVDKKKSRTAANIRRTPFEEENYVSSAWSRPQHVPFKLGPRSIRVLGPEPGLVISNVSSDATKGHALDGTVNRVLLKLEADTGESCENIEISATCFSVLITPTGTTKRLVSEEELMSPETENSLSMADGRWRTPVFVEETASLSDVQTVNGFDLPIGWKASNTGQQKTTMINSLQRGQTTHYVMDFYRPSAIQIGDPSQQEDPSKDRLGELSICKTDFYLTIKYKQIRHRETKAPLKRGRRRPPRRKPVMPSKATSGNENIPPSEGTTSPPDDIEGEDYEDVSLEYSGSVCWINPLVAMFQLGHSDCTSSGVDSQDNKSNELELSDQAMPFVAVSGCRLPLRCTLSSSIASLPTEILQVYFEVSDV